MQTPDIIKHWTGEAAAQARKEALQQGIQQGMQQGMQQGLRERALEDILEVLELRLQPAAANIFKPTIEAIEDPQHLKQLFRAAIRVETSDDFINALEALQQ